MRFIWFLIFIFSTASFASERELPAGTFRGVSFSLEKNGVTIFSNKDAVKLHKNFIDPSRIEFENDEKKIETFIYVRNQIKTYCLDFANKFFPDR